MQGASLGARLGGAVCMSIAPVIFLSFYVHQLKIDNLYNSDTDCCAYDDGGSYVSALCIDAANYAGTSYDVTSEFRYVCIWGVALFTLQIAGNLAMAISIKLAPVAGLIHAVASCGIFAWLITLTVFVFRE